MPAFRINVKAHHKGPIFNASATKAAGNRMVININEAIAQEGVNMVRARLDTVLQHPTGYYRSRIAIERRQTYRGIWDQNVIYGGWLEGVTSRNRTSRFKGYRTFRRVKQELDNRQEAIARPMVAQYVRELS
jgi:hypothetical protein